MCGKRVVKQRLRHHDSVCVCVCVCVSWCVCVCHGVFDLSISTIAVPWVLNGGDGGGAGIEMQMCTVSSTNL